MLLIGVVFFSSRTFLEGSHDLLQYISHALSRGCGDLSLARVSVASAYQELFVECLGWVSQVFVHGLFSTTVGPSVGHIPSVVVEVKLVARRCFLVRVPCIFLCKARTRAQPPAIP